MSNRSPIFPMPEPQHFSDYGFDPQIDYFQLLEGARNRKRKTVTARLPVDSLHLKLRKPISNEDSASRKVHKAKNKKKKWWRNAMLFFKWKCIHSNHRDYYLDHENVHESRARGFRASVSGSVYLIDSLSGSSTPSRSTGRPSSGALAGTLTPARKGDLEIPYLSLMDLNMEQQQRRSSTSANPIYLAFSFIFFFAMPSFQRVQTAKAEKLEPPEIGTAAWCGNAVVCVHRTTSESS